MSAYPPIIVSLGRVPAPKGALVIDYLHGQFWMDGRPLLIARNRQERPTIAFRVAAALLSHGPGIMLSDALFQAVWGDDESGGPESLANNVWTRIGKWRPLFDSLGIHVTGKHGWGYMVSHHTPAEMAVIRAKRAVRAKLIEKGRKAARRAPENELHAA